MRILGIFFLLLFQFSATHSQPDFRVIGFIDQIADSISTDFYIQDVEDGRAFKANLGIVNRGARKHIKRPLVPGSGFFASMKQRMNRWLRPGVGAEPVVAVLKELYFWESRGGGVPVGFVRLKMGFVGKSGQEETVISVELSGKELTVAKGHAPRLEMALFRSLQNYSGRRNSPEQNRTSQNGTEKHNLVTGSLLAASCFLDLRNGKLFSTSGKLRRKGGFFRYQLRRKGEPAESPYFSLVKDDKLFIWAQNYPGAGNYYTRVLEHGRYLFLIDDIFMSVSASQSESKQFSGKVGIVLDMETGVPEVVDDEVMKRLLAPYPDLEEKYLFKDILKFPFQLTRVQNVIAEINRREKLE